ncbi:MAG: alpha/beta fold hydrolase [Azospirillum sp.]|nr:alpha/beta fold hydrolase [Azospirillum sp.]
MPKTAGAEPLPLILLPGLLCDHALWRHQTDHLSDVSEPWVADLSGAVSIADLAASVLAAAPPRFALAGLSMGGYVAFEIMRRAPERVVRLALLDTSARPDTPEQTRRRRGLMALARRGAFRGVTPQLLPILIHPDRQSDAALTGEIVTMAERVGRQAFLDQQTAILHRPDSRPGLGAIACPTLVLCGRQDALTPLAVMTEIADAIPGARLAVIEDCGHLSPLERPDAVTAQMRRWLTGL